MAYTPTTWSSGDTITATKLNKIEQGIAGVNLLVGTTTTINGSTTTVTLDKTCQEIYDAFMAGDSIKIIVSDTSGSESTNVVYLVAELVTYTGSPKSGTKSGTESITEYGFVAVSMMNGNTIPFTAYSANDYPFCSQNNTIS